MNKNICKKYSTKKKLEKSERNIIQKKNPTKMKQKCVKNPTKLKQETKQQRLIRRRLRVCVDCFCFVFVVVCLLSFVVVVCCWVLLLVQVVTWRRAYSWECQECRWRRGGRPWAPTWVSIRRIWRCRRRCCTIRKRRRRRCWPPSSSWLLAGRPERADRTPDWPWAHSTEKETAGSFRRKDSGGRPTTASPIRAGPCCCFRSRPGLRGRPSCSWPSPWASADCCTCGSRPESWSTTTTGWTASWSRPPDWHRAGGRCLRRLHRLRRRHRCSDPLRRSRPCCWPPLWRRWAGDRRTFASCWRRRPSPLASWPLRSLLAPAAASGAPLLSSASPNQSNINNNININNILSSHGGIRMDDGWMMDTCMSDSSMELVPCLGRLGRRGSSTGDRGRRFSVDGSGGCRSGSPAPAMWPLGGRAPSLGPPCSLPADDPDSGIETEESSLDREEPARRPPSTLQANGSLGSSMDMLKNIPNRPMDMFSK